MKTFIETSPFIYLIENNPQFAAKARKFILGAVTMYRTKLFSMANPRLFFLNPESFRDIPRAEFPPQYDFCTVEQEALKFQEHLKIVFFAKNGAL